MSNLAFPELVLIGLAAVLVVVWVMGVAKLFSKGHAVLGIVAIIGVVFPPIALLGFAGWFVAERAATDSP